MKTAEQYFGGSRSADAVRRMLLALSALTALHCTLRQERSGVSACLMTVLLLLILPFAGRRLRVRLPAAMQITAMLFLFSACVLGETACFYLRFPCWDILLHAVSGALCAAFGFCLGELPEKPRALRLSPLLCTVTAFCFSMTVGVLWEFLEFSADRLLGLDMQKDTVLRGFQSVLLDASSRNHPLPVQEITETVIRTADGTAYTVSGYLDIGLTDTMKDLFFNFAGAALFSAAGYLHLARQGKCRFAAAFIPQRKSPDSWKECP